jgi:two-component system CheB/CheR fusion protein
MRPELERLRRGGVGAKRVLVVDDNADQLTALAGNLRLEGYSIEAAFNGLEALKMAKDWRPDFVLLDIGLPDLDGYEVARRMRAVPEIRGTKLIAVTAHGSESDLAQAREVGFDGHITKPVELRKLLSMMAPGP